MDGRGQLSQTCSRRNNRWLLNRKRACFLWGRRYRYENAALALRKRTTCLVSSVSFVSRFLPVNKPGLHPPAAAGHPSSKDKARWLVVSRDAGKLGATLLPCLSLPLSFSLVRRSRTALSFARDDRLLRIVRFDLRRASAAPCSSLPRMRTISHKERVMRI